MAEMEGTNSGYLQGIGRILQSLESLLFFGVISKKLIGCIVLSRDFRKIYLVFRLMCTTLMELLESKECKMKYTRLLTSLYFGLAVDFDRGRLQLHIWFLR